MKQFALLVRYLKITLHYLNRHKIKIRQNLLIFLFFLIASTAIWFINALRKNYPSTIAFPVKYINFPNDKLSVGELPPYLFILVKSTGYNLLLNKIKPPSNPIVIDVNSYALSRINEKKSKYFLRTSYIIDNLQNQISSEMKIIAVNPDTLHFQFDKVYKKKVRVIPSIKVEFRKQYSFKDIPTVKPDSILVYGPKVVIDTLRFIKTESFIYRNVNKSIEKRHELQKIFNLTYSLKHVMVNIPVEKYTEASINIPIEIKNLPDSLKLKIIPEFVSVSCKVGLSNFEKIKPYYFKASVDYKNTKDKFSRKIKITIDEFPRMISGLKYFPQKVDYIIKKKY